MSKHCVGEIMGNSVHILLATCHMMAMVNVEFMQHFIFWLYAMSVCQYILKHFGDSLPQLRRMASY